MAWAACLPIVVAAVLLLIFTLRGWSSRFGQRRHWVVRIGLRLTWEVALPVALLLGALLLANMLGATNWDEILLAWPDVGLWILVISAVLLLTCVLRIEDDLANYNKLLSVQKAGLGAIRFPERKQEGRGVSLNFAFDVGRNFQPFVNERNASSPRQDWLSNREAG